MRRQTFTALTAPGVNSGSNGSLLSGFGMERTEEVIKRFVSRLPVQSGQPRFGLLNHVVDYFLQVAGFLEHAQLPVGAAALVQDRVDVFQFFARVQFIDDVIDEIKILAHQVAGRNFLLLAEIHQLAVESIARGAPLVLHDQGSAIETESLIGCIELVQLGYGRLNQGSQCYRLVGAHGNVAYPEFEGVEERVRANVPPDLLGVVDAVGLNQQLDEVFVLAPTGEIIGNISAGKFVEHLAAV